jgi:hypothetical protein
MKICAALLVVVLLCGAGAARAQTDLESKLVVSLTLNVQTDVAGDDDDTKVRKIRFSTKDFVEAMKDVLDNDELKTPVLQRENVAAGDIPAGFILNQTLVVRQRDGTEIDPADADFLATPLGLDALLGTTELLRSAARDKDDANLGLLGRKLIVNEAATWRFDEGGDGDTDDQIVLDLLCFSTVTSRRTFDGEIDLGLWYTSRVADVHGGMSVDVNSGFGTVALTGVLRGTIKAVAEKIQLAP